MKKYFSHLLTFSFFTLLFLGGCVKEDFDEPPLTGEDPANITDADIVTIQSLKETFELGTYLQLATDKYVRATVVADDESGNFYKQLIIQDESAGIILLIDQVELYNQYPVGQRVFVKLDQLWLGDFAGTIQLGGQAVDTDNDGNLDRVFGIPDVLLDETVIRGRSGLDVTPEVLTFTQLTNDKVGSLIQINNVQFEEDALGETYADVDGQRSENRTLEGCDGGSLIVRSSGFSNFAGQPVAQGSGNIIGVYTLFGSTKQFIIRDTSDVQFTGSRCDGGGPIGGTGATGTLISIQDLQGFYSGTTVNAPSDRKIKGIVISDLTTNHTNALNVVIQDGDRGILVRFGGEHNYRLGDEIEVGTDNAELSEFAGLLQLNNATISNSGKTGTGTITPATVTIASYLANSADLRSTLLKFEEVFLSGGNVYDGNVTMTDATGTVTLRTSGGATFANEQFPTDEVSITAIGSIFVSNTGSVSEQVNIRSTEDVVVTGGGPGTGVVTGTLISVQEIQNIYMGTAMDAPADRKIRGIVISDLSTGHINSRNLVLQDGDRGIVVRFTVDHNYQLGDEVEIGTASGELSEFNDLLQLNNANLANSAKVGTGTVTANTMTVGDYLSQASALESTLIKFENLKISKDGGSDYNGETMLNDGTGTTVMFTGAGADFASESFPTDTVSLTGIAGVFNGTAQVNIRSSNDVVVTGGNGGGPGGDVVNEDFQSGQTNNQDVNIAGWTNVATTGVRKWQAKEFQGNFYAQATAFNDDEPNMETWLITAGIDLSTPRTLTFNSAKAFYTHDGLSVWISTNYDGANVNAATWTELTSATLAVSGDADHAFIPSGDVDLSAFSGTGYIGFKYTGGSATQTGTFRVDDVVVE